VAPTVNGQRLTSAALPHELVDDEPGATWYLSPLRRHAQDTS
jgi:hypothetical protein